MSAYCGSKKGDIFQSIEVLLRTLLGRFKTGVSVKIRQAQPKRYDNYGPGLLSEKKC